MMYNLFSIRSIFRSNILLLKRDWDSFRLIRWNKNAENKVTEDRTIGIRNAS